MPYKKFPFRVLHNGTVKEVMAQDAMGAANSYIKKLFGNPARCIEIKGEFWPIKGTFNLGGPLKVESMR